jgi:hypothetical protein
MRAFGLCLGVTFGSAQVPGLDAQLLFWTGAARRLPDWRGMNGAYRAQTVDSFSGARRRGEDQDAVAVAVQNLAAARLDGAHRAMRLGTIAIFQHDQLLTTERISASHGRTLLCVDEVLVVLVPFGPLTARDLASREPVASGGPQLFGERVLICRLDPDCVGEVAAEDGVAGVFESSVPDDLVDEADLAGQLAVRAWNSRKAVGIAPKERIGDGAAWDDPAFEPEGRPTSAEDDVADD